MLLCPARHMPRLFNPPTAQDGVRLSKARRQARDLTGPVALGRSPVCLITGHTFLTLRRAGETSPTRSQCSLPIPLHRMTPYSEDLLCPPSAPSVCPRGRRRVPQPWLRCLLRAWSRRQHSPNWPSSLTYNSRAL